MVKSAVKHISWEALESSGCRIAHAAHMNSPHDSQEEVME